MNTENNKLKKASKKGIIIGFVFSIVGGVMGVVIGLRYVLGNYDSSTKKKAWIMIIIGFIVTVVLRRTIPAGFSFGFF